MKNDNNGFYDPKKLLNMEKEKVFTIEKQYRIRLRLKDGSSLHILISLEDLKTAYSSLDEMNIFKRCIVNYIMNLELGTKVYRMVSYKEIKEQFLQV